jgi:hypothetical protein
MAKRNTEKVLQAARLRILGKTQAGTARAVGVTERTVQNWEASDEWKDATSEARDDYAKDLAAKVRLRLIESLDDPAYAVQTARALALKILPELQNGGGERSKRPYVWWDMGNHIAEFE